MPRSIPIGALLALVAVGAGAFGAHALKERLDAHALEIWDTAARYQMYHAIALVLAGLVGERTKAAGARRAAWAFGVGIALFSGSLYALALSGVKVLGAITPLGGLAFMTGWALLAHASWRTSTPTKAG